MWVQIKATSDSIEINMDKDRPLSFESRADEVEWDRIAAKNALRLKKLVESGQYIPPEILQKLQSKVNRTPEEEAILKHNIEISNIKEKVRKIRHAAIWQNFLNFFLLNCNVFFLGTVVWRKKLLRKIRQIDTKALHVWRDFLASFPASWYLSFYLF